MTEHVARTLCRAAAATNRRDALCPVCDHIDDVRGTASLGECVMWPTFVGEARGAIEAVRDHARLDMRRRPRQRTAFEIVGAL